MLKGQCIVCGCLCSAKEMRESLIVLEKGWYEVRLFLHNGTKYSGDEYAPISLALTVYICPECEPKATEIIRGGARE